MKNFLILFLLILCSTQISHAQNSYDPDLAKQLGADEYGMKKYVIAFGHRGDRVGEYSAAKRAEFLAGHMANITRLAEERKPVLASPFFGNELLRGLFFFNVESIAEADKLTVSDPSIQAGILKMEMNDDRFRVKVFGEGFGMIDGL
jgi:hypothetical protein